MLLLNLNILETIEIENKRHQIKVQKLFLKSIEEDLITINIYYYVQITYADSIVICTLSHYKTARMLEVY